MAVQIRNVSSFSFLRKFIGPKNPLMSASIAYFVFLRRSEKKIAAQKCIWCLCANLATMWVCVFCCDGQNEALVGRKYQFSSNMFLAYGLDNVRSLNGIYTTFSWNLYRQKWWDFSC